MDYITLPFVCFRCRRSWKIDCSNRAWFYEWGVQARDAWKNARPCPLCRGPLSFGGVYLRTPPQSNARRWKILEMLVRSGWTDDSRWSSVRTLVRSAPAARELVEQAQNQAALRAKRDAIERKHERKAARKTRRHQVSF